MFFINAQGFAVYGMITVLIGAILNIFLDPLFIFTFNMGIKGAAIATVISQMVSSIFVLWFLFFKKNSLKLEFKYMKLSFKTILPILALGLSPFVMQATEALVQLTLNSSMEKYASSVSESTQLVAALGVIFSVMQIISLPLSGLSQGVGPIISYNYGANKIDRVKKTIKITIFIAFCFLVVVNLLIQFCPIIFIKFLSPSEEVTSICIRSIKIFTLGTIFFTFQFPGQQAIVALGEAKVSLCLALLRKVILLIPLALILPLFIVPSTDGVLWAEPLADAIAGTITAIVFILRTRYLFRKKESKV